MSFTVVAMPMHTYTQCVGNSSARATNVNWSDCALPIKRRNEAGMITKDNRQSEILNLK